MKDRAIIEQLQITQLQIHRQNEILQPGNALHIRDCFALKIAQLQEPGLLGRDRRFGYEGANLLAARRSNRCASTIPAHATHAFRIRLLSLHHHRLLFSLAAMTVDPSALIVELSI